MRVPLRRTPIFLSASLHRHSGMAAASLLSKMRLPVIGAPLFIISNPSMVVEQCKAGIIGSFPALNARPKEKLEARLVEISSRLAEHDATHERKSAPFAVNQIVHRSNDRLLHDMELIVKHRVPLVITSLGAREDVNEAVHSYGGLVMHDVTNNYHAKKAIAKGADGLIAVCAGRCVETPAGEGRGSLFVYSEVCSLRTAPACRTCEVMDT